MQVTKKIRPAVAAKKKLSQRKADKAISFEYKLELFTKSIIEQYPQDPTFPSLSLSYRTNVARYYASVTRYKETYARGPYSAMHTEGETQYEAISKLFTEWMIRIAPSKDATQTLIAAKNRGEF